ncbi:MAG: hypothetical protein NPINA01_32970 [Nitrospinaceae bacterium]|nr:MAG: hypothetical protein NPINA01_32970 [Nitrospinaceae bacterium]
MGINSIETVCPCCETKLKIDVKTGEVIWQEEKPKPAVSLSEMVKGLDAQKKEQEALFKKRSESHKERGRVLDEKFKEAQKNVDKSGDRPLRDIDFD